MVEKKKKNDQVWKWQETKEMILRSCETQKLDACVLKRHVSRGVV